MIQPSTDARLETEGGGEPIIIVRTYGLYIDRSESTRYCANPDQNSDDRTSRLYKTEGSTSNKTQTNTLTM